LILSAQGCGRKADPVPIRVAPLKPVADVRCQALPEGIFVRWSIPEQPREMVRFQILRSEIGRDKEACPGCPPEARKIADVTVTEAKRVTASSNAGGYMDTAIDSGRTYRYRVVGCDRDGFCSEDSVSAGSVTATGKDSR
jgi:hypothetical protein